MTTQALVDNVWLVDQSSSPLLSGLQITQDMNANINKPVVSFTADFTSLQPISFTVSDQAFNQPSDQDLRAEFSPTIINESGANWAGFRIDLIDSTHTMQTGVHPL